MRVWGIPLQLGSRYLPTLPRSSKGACSFWDPRPNSPTVIVGIGCEMDVYEATRIVFARIQSVEPEHVSKIIGYLLLQDHGDREMIRLAFGPDNLIQSFISKAKKELGLGELFSSSPLHTSTVQILSDPYVNNLSNPYLESSGQFANTFSHISSRPFPSPTIRSPHTLSYWDPQVHQEAPLISRPSNFHEQNILNVPGNSLMQDPMFANELQLQDQVSFIDNDYISPDQIQVASLNEGCKLSPMDYLSRRPASIADHVKPCIYFARGYCKHGINCRYLHGYSTHENLIPISVNSSPPGSVNEETLSTGSLERLEFELLELLRGIKRAPVSIAALPQLYYERFGRTLRAEGYLTESQRHGKAGYSLTKLLARLKNTVKLIDRPHGQHAVVLVEDAPRFTEYRSERNDIAGLIAGSRQIYLTFPAESTFTEEDVSNYFRTYGPVQDVRIPYQQKRMFGFVTFVHPETARTVLTKGNPHYVCGARVLVKPYREKGRHGDRKYTDKIENSTRYSPAVHNLDLEYDLPLAPRLFDNPEIGRRQLLEAQDEAIELERRRLAGLHLGTQVSQLPATNVVHVNEEVQNPSDEKSTEDINGFPLTDRFSYLLDVLNGDSVNGDKPKQNNNEQESNIGHNLPESPFATSVLYAANNISTVT